MFKRKSGSPPCSPALNKKRLPDELDTPGLLSGGSEEAGSGKRPHFSENFRIIKAPVGCVDESIDNMIPADEAIGSFFDKDGDDQKTYISKSVANISHVPGNAHLDRRPPEISESVVPLRRERLAQSSGIPHRIPSHAGWFQWKRVHEVERFSLPELLNGKDNLNSAETYMDQRNCIIAKHRENPTKLMKLKDVQGLISADSSVVVRLFGFLDHWGLINYQAFKDCPSFSSSGGFSDSVEEVNNGALHLNPLMKPALTNLFEFETAVAHVPQSVCVTSVPTSQLPLSNLAEALVQESLAAPAVEYHCNSCQADCSKRRYHCQKQADFDLCADCFSDGKFGQGMTGMDFLRMDALMETTDVNGGGWSDQETLLLLEALELYGDNWNEIAEHVATKSKAQCILHFVRLPIEDPFLEDMESINSVTAAQQHRAVVVETSGSAQRHNTHALTQNNENVNLAVCEGKNAEHNCNTEHDLFPMIQVEKAMPHKVQTTENAHTCATEDKEIVSETDTSESRNGDCSIAHTLLAAAQSAGCCGLDGLIAFADAGNPVMAQVAFLAAMVGPRVAAAAAQTALSSLAEQESVGCLSLTNSLVLDLPDKKENAVVSGSPERPTGQARALNQSVPSRGSFVKLSDCEGAAMVQKSEVTTCTGISVAEKDAPSTSKVRNAAVSALASAAVKAKLLADQEEREIQRLVAGVIENQLKKLEMKLKHFGELELMLGRECEQAEKARAKVHAERARIVASRLGSSTGTTQVESMVSPSTLYTKSLSQCPSVVTQLRHPVFTFGPAGVSVPVATCKAPLLPESTTPFLTDSSGQQDLAPQRFSRGLPGGSVPSGVKQCAG